MKLRLGKKDQGLNKLRLNGTIYDCTYPRSNDQLLIRDLSPLRHQKKPRLKQCKKLLPPLIAMMRMKTQLISRLNTNPRLHQLVQVA